MNRDDAATYVGARYGNYLAAASRAATDTAGNLAEIIDDAFRALGVADADLATAATDDATGDADLRVQVAYRTMAQVARDLRATSFDVSTGGDSYKLSQLRDAAEIDRQLAAAMVLARFGTLEIAPVGGDGGYATLDLNFLGDVPAGVA